MKIVSRILPAEPLTDDLARTVGLPPDKIGQPLILMAFSTRVAGKTVITGIGVGTGDTVTPIAHAVLDRMGRYARPGSSLRLVQCFNSATARRRAIKEIDRAADGDLVFICCKDSTIYDAVKIFSTLGLERGAQP